MKVSDANTERKGKWRSSTHGEVEVLGGRLTHEGENYLVNAAAALQSGGQKKKKGIALQRQSVFATDEGAGTSLLMRNRRGSLGNLRVVWWQRRRQTLMCTEMQRMTQEIGVCSPMSEMRKPKCISTYLGIYVWKQFGALFPKNAVTREIQSENNVYCSSCSVVTEDLQTIPCCPTWTKLKLLSAAPCFFIPLL